MDNAVIKQSNETVQFNFFDPAQFATMQRVCTMFASSELVPEMYRMTDKNPREKAIANCMIAIETANRIGASPLMVMQNMYIVYGQPGWSAKFLIATVNSCGRYNSLKYKMTNIGSVKNANVDVENWECIAYTSEKNSDEILESIPVSIDMAIKEGWYNKTGSKWKTMPKLMLQYRAATLWTRVYAPELSMGMRTEDELHDIEEIPYEDVSEKVQKEIKSHANGTAVSMDIPKDPPAAAKEPDPKSDQANDDQAQKATDTETKQPPAAGTQTKAPF